jgi:hypothetical protein
VSRLAHLNYTTFFSVCQYLFAKKIKKSKKEAVFHTASSAVNGVDYMLVKILVLHISI